MCFISLFVSFATELFRPFPTFTIFVCAFFPVMTSRIRHRITAVEEA